MIGMTTLIALTTRSQHVQSLALITHHITDKVVYLNEAKMTLVIFCLIFSFFMQSITHKHITYSMS